MVRTQEGFLAEDDLGASDVYEREDAENAGGALPASAIDALGVTRTALCLAPTYMWNALAQVCT